MSTTNDVTTHIPAGTWQVDPTSSALGFGARGMFGLVPVHGLFREFAGTMTVDSAGASGALEIQAASLDSGNAKRDEHLRGADFFDVENNPTVTFELTGVKPGSDGTVNVRGVLRIRDSALAIDTPVTAAQDDSDRLVLMTALDVDRTAAGVGWSKMGMIKGKAHLDVKLTLTKLG